MRCGRTIWAVADPVRTCSPYSDVHGCANCLVVIDTPFPWTCGHPALECASVMKNNTASRYACHHISSPLFGGQGPTTDRSGSYCRFQHQNLRTFPPPWPKPRGPLRRTGAPPSHCPTHHPRSCLMLTRHGNR